MTNIFNSLVVTTMDAVYIGKHKFSGAKDIRDFIEDHFKDFYKSKDD